MSKSKHSDRRGKEHEERFLVDEKVTIEQAEGDVVVAGGDEREEGWSLAERMANRVRINVPVEDNPALEEIISRVNEDEEVYALWIAENMNATRLGMTDHGPVHVKIVMNIAIKLLRMLDEAGIETGVAQAYGLTSREAQVVVALAALFHDSGMSIHRIDHEAFSLFVSQGKLAELLEGVYDVPTATVLRSDILHAIIAHRSKGTPLTVEAGVVRVADALDMAKGRSRISYKAAASSIHSISAAAIESVSIEQGERRPIRLLIRMSNSAGVFQIDQLLREKLAGSGLEEHIEVIGRVEGEEAERRLLSDYRM